MGSITIGRMLRLARADKGLTQKQLVIDVYKLHEKDFIEIRNKVMFYSAIENDRSPVPEAIMVKLCSVLNLPIEQLIDAKVRKYRAKLEKIAAKSK